MIVLHDYFRSSASYRVRIALALKGVACERRTVDLREAQQRSDIHRALNPQGLVPVLEIDGLRLIQSFAIIDYLDQRFPHPPLVPAKPAERAQAYALAQIIACDIHPLNNLRVLNYLERELGVDETGRQRWYRQWVAEGFTAIEAMLIESAGTYCLGNNPGLADIFLVPQVYNARRFDVDLVPYPTICACSAAAEALPAFAAAHPDVANT